MRKVAKEKQLIGFIHNKHLLKTFQINYIVPVSKAISLEIITTFFSSKTLKKINKKSSKARFEKARAEPHLASSYSAKSELGNSYVILSLINPSIW